MKLKNKDKKQKSLSDAENNELKASEEVLYISETEENTEQTKESTDGSDPIEKSKEGSESAEEVNKTSELTEEANKTSEQTEAEKGEDFGQIPSEEKVTDKTEKDEGEAEQKTWKKRFFASFGKVHIIIISVASAVLLALFAFILWVSSPVKCEAGDRPDYSRITESSFVGSLCKVKSNLDETDTSHTGKVSVELEFFGFLKVRSKLRVVDTVFPELQVADVVVTSDVNVTPQMFITSLYDKTSVSVAMDSLGVVYEEGEYAVTLSAVDEGLNVTEVAAKLTVRASSPKTSFEYEVTKETLEKAFFSLFPEAETVTVPEISDCGEYVLWGEAKEGGVRFYTPIEIKDTKPPVADVVSWDIVLGETLSEEDIVKNIDDHSEVTVELQGLPDFKSTGDHEIRIKLTDAFGNVSEYISGVCIHDIETDITAELGCDNATLAEVIFKDDFSREILSFKDDRVTRNMIVGENQLELTGKYGSVTVKVTLVDTVPPDFTLHSERYLVGTIFSPTDLVLSFRDASEVTFAFETEPDYSKEGTFDITVIATDSSGNTSSQTTSVTFFYDLDAPVISGYRDLSYIIGEPVDFSSGVTAYDAVCGNVKVKTDASSVNLNVAGTYSVTYTATDTSGNTATVTVTVTLREPVRVKLDVTCIMQRPALYNGCEATCLAMALGYKGYSVSPVYLFETFMAKSPFQNGDPWTSYVGNPYVKGEGYGCYASCVVETGNKYLESVDAAVRVYDVSGMGLSYYESLIDEGTPVILWGTTKMSGRDKICWEAEIDGKNVCWLSSSHTLLLIGYTDYTYIFCDPLEGVVEYDRAAVEKSYVLNFRQACVVK